MKRPPSSFYFPSRLPYLPTSCSWLARTDPRDVARVESKTVIVTRDQRDTVPTPPEGGVSQLGRWMSPEEFDKAMAQRFPGCMKGTTENRFGIKSAPNFNRGKKEEFSSRHGVPTT